MHTEQRAKALEVMAPSQRPQKSQTLRRSAGGSGLAEEGFACGMATAGSSAWPVNQYRDYSRIKKPLTASHSSGVYNRALSADARSPKSGFTYAALKRR